MKLAKSLLLGSAAGFVAVASAQAADLPVRKAAPVDYVRVCSAYGAGFFYIPGTDTCLRVGGRLRAETLYQEPKRSFGINDAFAATGGRQADSLGFRARGRLNIDARTETEYGTLRAFLRYEITRNTGPYAGGFGNTAVISPNIDKGFIQFAGFTAGRVQSFFDFYADDLNWGGQLGSDRSTQVLAYTATFGAGFSATLSLEDRTERSPQGTAFQRQTITNFTATPGIPLVAQGQFFTSYGNAGARTPDPVGVLRYDAAFGSFQLSAAGHQLRPAYQTLAVSTTGAQANTFAFPTGTLVNTGGVTQGVLGVNTATGAFGVTPREEYGFAVQGGAKIKMDFIAPGDVLWLQAAYASGALDYLGGVGNGITSIGSLGQTFSEAIVTNGNKVRQTKGFSVVAAFLHYWTPTLRQAVFGTYQELDYSRVVDSNNAFFTANGGPVTAANPLLASAPVAGSSFVRDTRSFQVGSNLIYSPVKDLDIGVEVLYFHVDPKGRVAYNTTAVGPSGLGTLTPGSTTANTAAIQATRFKSSEDQLTARIRVQRDF